MKKNIILENDHYYDGVVNSHKIIDKMPIHISKCQGTMSF